MLDAALLHVPTGSLGLTAVASAAAQPEWQLAIPSGDYLLDGYEIDVDWDEEIEPVPRVIYCALRFGFGAHGSV